MGRPTGGLAPDVRSLLAEVVKGFDGAVDQLAFKQGGLQAQIGQALAGLQEKLIPQHVPTAMEIADKSPAAVPNQVAQVAGKDGVHSV